MSLFEVRNVVGISGRSRGPQTNFLNPANLSTSSFSSASLRWNLNDCRSYCRHHARERGVRSACSGGQGGAA